MRRPDRLTVMVSSAVYGIEPLLDQVFATLKGFGYQVWMSHKGTIPVHPKKTAFQSCLEAVERCDIFLGIITGLIFFLIEKSNDVVRFHAAQSIVFSGAVIVLWIVLMIVGLILTSISWTLGNVFGLLTLVLWLGLFVVWVVLLIKGYSGEKWKLPVLGDIAERIASGQRTV